MLRRIIIYGAIAGAIAGGVLSAFVVLTKDRESLSGWGMAIGYLTMLVAFSTIFMAIKRQRDVDGGGVIRFWPALGLGLGISVVAGIVYAAAWDTTLALTHLDFARGYADAVVAAERAKGVSGDALAKVVAQMDEFRRSYANPLYRWTMTFAEIVPVGVLVSLISAALLRNPRFLPARRS